MLYFVFPGIPESAKGAFSVGSQPMTLLMFHNMARAAGLDELTYIDEAISSFDTDQLRDGDRVFLSCNLFNVDRARQIVSTSLAKGAEVILGGPALEVAGGNLKMLGIESHLRLTAWHGGWRESFCRFAKEVGLSLSNCTWDSLARFQRDRLDTGHLEQRSLDFRNRSGLAFRGNLVNLHSRVGCLYRESTGGCSFCSRHHEDYSVIQPETYVSIVRELSERWGAGLVWDTADSFFESRQELDRLGCGGLFDETVELMVFARAAAIHPQSAELLKRCGVRYVIVGVESGSDRILDIANKTLTVKQAVRAIVALTHAGIASIPCFTLGHPTETQAEIDATVELAQRLASTCEIAVVSCSTVVPIPGSRYGALLSSRAGCAQTLNVKRMQETYFANHVGCSLEYATEAARNVESLRRFQPRIWR